MPHSHHGPDGPATTGSSNQGWRPGAFVPWEVVAAANDYDGFDIAPGLDLSHLDRSMFRCEVRTTDEFSTHGIAYLETDEESVAEFIGMAGDSAPPILIGPPDPGAPCELLDGAHRVLAAIRRKDDGVRAFVAIECAS